MYIIKLITHLIGIGALLLSSLSADQYLIQSSADFLSLPTLSAGDEVVILAGDYDSVDVVLQFNGTASNPAKVYASTAGTVQFTGSTRLILDGQYGIVAGLSFTDQAGPLQKEGIIKFEEHSRNITLHNCQFLDCNNSALTDANWLFIEGYHHEVSRCSFEGKTSLNATVFIKPTEEDEVTTTREHRLVYCYFGPRTELGDNGYEAIRVSDSSRQAYEMQCDISYNYFYQAISGDASEMEVISNKSRGNRYRGNLLEDCDGQITLRHGRDCIVEENYIIGTGSSRESGIRVIGSGHIIRNNYIKEVNGTGLRSALCIMDGEYGRTDNQYEGVENTLVEGNVIVNCSLSLNMGENKGYDDPPINTVLVHNKIYNENGETLLAVEADATFAMVQGNEFYTSNVSIGDDLSALAGGYEIVSDLEPSTPFTPVLLPETASELTGHDFSQLMHTVPETIERGSETDIEVSSAEVSLAVEANAGEYLNVYVTDGDGEWTLFSPSQRATSSGVQHVEISREELLAQEVITDGTRAFYVVEVADSDHHEESPVEPPLPPEDVFVESDGVVVIEAEAYHASADNGDSTSWSTVNDEVSYQTTTSGSVAVWESAAELSYQVQFITPGTYYIHPRFRALTSSDDSFFFGANGTLVGQVNTGISSEWTWDNNETETLVIDTAGVYTIQIRRREAGLELDQFILTTDAGASY